MQALSFRSTNQEIVRNKTLSSYKMTTFASYLKDILNLNYHYYFNININPRWVSVRILLFCYEFYIISEKP